MSAELLKLDGVGVRLGGREVLRDVSLTVHPGEFTGLIGPNGAGKTTLLRIILGLQPVTRGSVLIDGAPRPPRDASIGYVPQKLGIEPDTPLRVRDVVSLGLDGHKFGIRLPSRARREQVDDMLTAVGARRYADARVGELSGGEQQRVMIAHALIGRPRLLLLDEPLANLDISSEQGIVSVLARLARAEGIAVLLSAHDMNPLMPVMDRIVYVAAGRVAVGTADEVVQPEVLSRLYGQHVDVIVPAVRPARRRDQGARPGPGGGRAGRHRRRRSRRRGRRRDPVSFLRYIVEPGFFGSGPVHIALAVGTVVAVTSAVTGVFTVTRGQSFAGHSLADIATTGGSGAFLVGLNQFWGYLAFGAGAAAFMEMIGIQRRRGRDVATGVVLGAALGLAALFLYLGTQYSTTTGASFTILFGSIFVITPSTVPALIVSALLALATVIALARVLLLSSLSPDLAAARGVPVRAVGAAFLMALAVSVALSAVVIGAVLSTALLIGPAATALRVTKGPVRAAAVAAGIGVAATWLGILLAYDSFYWPPAGRGWPVSFFVVTLVVGGYLVTYLRRPVTPAEPAPDAEHACSAL